MSRSDSRHRLYQIRGLATHRKMLKNGSRMKTGVGQTTVSYCPHCTDEQQQKANSDKWRSHPQYMVHVSITGQKVAHCQERAFVESALTWPWALVCPSNMPPD